MIPLMAFGRAYDNSLIGINSSSQLTWKVDAKLIFIWKSVKK